MREGLRIGLLPIAQQLGRWRMMPAFSSARQLDLG
jgi:hypothetical protein